MQESQHRPLISIQQVFLIWCQRFEKGKEVGRSRRCHLRILPRHKPRNWFRRLEKAAMHQTRFDQGRGSAQTPLGRLETGKRSTVPAGVSHRGQIVGGAVANLLPHLPTPPLGSKGHSLGLCAENLSHAPCGSRNSVLHQVPDNPPCVASNSTPWSPLSPPPTIRESRRLA